MLLIIKLLYINWSVFGLVLSLTKQPDALDKGAPGCDLYNIRKIMEIRTP
ncbi:hypothetical protein SAMN05428975_1667 [Mucilaginibacter sp. OK268]|nr:hypothetical protein SAMN05428975_1667 [Mucilaginibacter sp. OK268]